MKTVLKTLPLALFTLLLTGSLQAETLVLSAATFVVDGTEANTNKDGGSSIQVRAFGGTQFNRKSYLQADVSGLLTTGEQFSNSSLDLKLYSSPFLGTTGATVSLNVYGITDGTAWDASLITWNNAPKNNTTSPSGVLSSGTTLLGTITIDSSTVVANDVVSLSGSALDDYLTWAEGNLGDFYSTGATSGPASFIITGNTVGDVGFQFYSDNNILADKPSLTYTVVPEPTTAMLLLVCGIALMGRRDHRAPKNLTA